MTDVPIVRNEVEAQVEQAAALAHRNYKNSWYQTILLAISALIALGAVMVASSTSLRQQAYETEIFANQTWESYRRLEMEYIEKYGENFGADPKNQQKQALYWLLVERLLMAADGVTISLEGDPQWRDSFIYEFRRHRSYLLGDEFLRHEDGVMSSYCTFRIGVRAWVRKAFESDKAASDALLAAENECKAALDREGFVE